MRAGDWAGALVLIVGCAGPRSGPPSVPAAQSATLEARLVSGGHDCRGRSAPQAAALAHETRQLADTLRAQGVRVPDPPLVDPDAAGLQRALRAPANGPVLWIYSGHGDLVQPGTHTLLTDAEKQTPTRVAASALCLADGPTRVDELMPALPRAPFAVLVVNACSSADVDVRGAPIDMSLVSLSTSKTKMIAGERTPLGEALGSTNLRSLDRDCDGSISDLELFAHLRDAFTSENYGEPILKLRRQSHRLPALLPATGCDASVPVAAAPADLHVEPYGHFGLWRVLVSGYLPPDAPVEILSHKVLANDLQATACRADVGQCFQPRNPF